jgi:hypothetical protein
MLRVLIIMVPNIIQRGAPTQALNVSIKLAARRASSHLTLVTIALPDDDILRLESRPRSFSVDPRSVGPKRMAERFWRPATVLFRGI